ncbi:MAG TPA: SDR family oxidoreductase [Rhodanobacteraceae bacterium]|nr:SDR family oxidoreductase [Rhodanobacteraceae bacterium]
MDMQLQGRRAIVTGASQGIGRAIAEALAAEGVAVSICARGEAALRQAHAALAAYGGRVHSATCDCADHAALATYIGAAADALGGIDILVNNVSGFSPGDDDAAWQRSLGVDVLASIRATRAALPALRDSDAACVVHVSSISGLRASPRTPAYAAAKAALINATQSQAAQLAPLGIRVVGLAPGSIDFPGGIWDRCRRDNPELYQRTQASVPFGRLGRPEEVARAAVFLASPMASWITGHTLVVDGGQLLGPAT